MFSSNKPSTPAQSEPLLGRSQRQPGFPLPGAPGSLRHETPSSQAEATEPDTAAPTSQPASTTTPAPEAAGARLLVGPEVKLRGAEILDCDTLVVEGRVEATMDSRVLHIAERGAFAGKVSIDVAEIHGSFEGELTVRDQLVIHATGRVKGKVRYGKLLVEAGATLCGDVETLAEQKKDEPRKLQTLLATASG